MRLLYWLMPFCLFAVLVAGCDSNGDTLIDEEPPVEVTIRLLGQLDLTPEGLTHSDVWGYVDPENGTPYALVGSLGGPDLGPELYVVDVSAPGAPVKVATVNVPAFDMKTYRHYAYTVTGGGNRAGVPEGRIVDLLDPANPVVVGEFDSSHNIFIDEDRGLMVLEVPGLRIYDLSEDPTEPRLLFQGPPRDGHDATVVGDRLYDFHGRAGTFIYDISDPAAPLLRGSITPPQISYHHSGWPTEDGRYLFLNDELARDTTADVTIWDIADPANPTRVAAIGDSLATVHNLFILGDLAYVSYYSAGFRVYDVSDPTMPRLADEYDTSPETSGQGFSGAWGVYPLAPSGHVYVSDRANGLFIFAVDP